MGTFHGDIDAEYNLAVRQGNAGRIRTLIKIGATLPNRLMLFALLQKHPELLSILKEAGANPNDEDGFHNTALGHAINYYPVEVVKTLLDLGADPNKESTHLLPLVHTAHNDQIEYVRALLNRGADPNLPQGNGVIALHSAVRNAQDRVAKLLLESGADPQIKGPDGKNSIDLATSIKRADLVKLLEAHVDSRSGKLERLRKRKSSKKRKG